jgi:hypothetical protein
MPYSFDKLRIIYHNASNYGQKSWTVYGFETFDDANEYLEDRLADLLGYSASGHITVCADKSIQVDMSCWRSCD